MRVGILQVDSVRDEIQAQHGDYPDMFHALLVGADPTITTRTYNVVDDEYPAEIDECAGYLITGSRDSVYDDLPWLPKLIGFVGELLACDVRVAGICFGHQLIAHHFGGHVAPASGGWGVGVHTSELTAPADMSLPWLDADRGPIALLSSHKDQVMSLPDGAIRYATNEFCPNAGFVTGENVLTIQGHPEFSKAYARELMKFRRTLLGEATFLAGIASLENPIEGDRMGGWLAAFYRG